MRKSKIQEEINRRYEEFEKKIKPLRDKIKEKDREELIRVLSKHKGIIYKKQYGKDFCVLKVLKSISKKGRLKYTEIIIEDKEDYHINYIKERNKVTKEEALKLVKVSLKNEQK